jgi:hypothetical protein
MVIINKYHYQIEVLSGIAYTSPDWLNISITNVHETPRRV